MPVKYKVGDLLEYTYKSIPSWCGVILKFYEQDEDKMNDDTIIRATIFKIPGKNKSKLEYEGYAIGDKVGLYSFKLKPYKRKPLTYGQALKILESKNV